ncbi:hypothetical protein [Cesiribacter sp. SM1]|uniref:hypothetical protein n=1 Tax=Cesiribacter sp. SM1 TaxID=2861196 RepID=UPI001CD32F24|nr:hypothetical protein [Cesiribacter sp. SM1]
MKKRTSPGISKELTLKNSLASLSLDLWGGAITDFHLLENGVNPLSFKFSSEQMPENNRVGAPYQGHFICLGRWGEPSEGEKRAGMPNHGQFANILWQQEQSEQRDALYMTATAPLEGLQLSRTLQLDADSAVIAVEEKVTNINPLGRVYNMVQHPTLSSPFLNAATVVDCNAKTGFNQFFSQGPNLYGMDWPMGITEEVSVINLRRPDKTYNAVYSFVVDKTSTIGWVTAFSPIHQTLIGYIWNRKDYPWIHLWQHWPGEQICYRGIEFGTAGIHKPFREILATAPRVFGECTFAYIDAGETVSRRYLAFLLKVQNNYTGVSSIEVAEGKIMIGARLQEQDTSIDTTFKDFL